MEPFLITSINSTPPQRVDNMDQREPKITMALQELANHPEKSVRSVARDFGLSEGTLRYRRNTGGSNMRSGHEFQQRLSRIQEEFLVDWILEQDAQGYPPSHTRTREMATKIIRLNGDTTPLGNKWVTNFIKRNPQVASVIGRRIEASRIDDTTPEEVQPFLQDLQRLKEVETRYDIQQAEQGTFKRTAL